MMMRMMMMMMMMMCAVAVDYRRRKREDARPLVGVVSIEEEAEPSTRRKFIRLLSPGRCAVNSVGRTLIENGLAGVLKQAFNPPSILDG
jgi:hypothetical protein